MGRITNLLIVTAVWGSFGADYARAVETELTKAPLPVLPDEFLQQLARGEIVRMDAPCESGAEDCIDYVTLTLVDRPPDEVFEIIADSAQHPEFMPSMDSAQLLDERGSADRVLAQLWEWHATVLLFDFQVQTIVLSDRRNGVIEWSINPEGDNDIADSHGHWWLYPQADKTQTLIAYWNVTESGVYLPDWFKRYISEVSSQEVIVNTRNRILSGGTWKVGDPPPE